MTLTKRITKQAWSSLERRDKQAILKHILGCAYSDAVVDDAVQMFWPAIESNVRVGKGDYRFSLFGGRLYII